MIEQISYEQVSNSASELIKSSQNVKTILEQVDQRMQKVNTEETWKSNAAEEMYNKFKALAKNFEAFYTAINTYGQFLNKTVETYKAADLAIKKKEDELLNSSTNV